MGKITEISFEKLFPYAPYLNYKIGAKATVSEVDSADEVFRQLKQQVDKWYEESGGFQNDEVAIIPTKNQQPPQDTEVGLLAAINACTEIKVLETFRLLINKQPKFKEAYDNKMIELTKKQK